MNRRVLPASSRQNEMMCERKACRRDADSTLAGPPHRLEVHGPNARLQSRGGFP
jgi:hypothetical protein